MKRACEEILKFGDNMECPNCRIKVDYKELMPSILTDSLLCCPNCKNKSRHVASIGTDPALAFNEVEFRSSKNKE